MFIDREKGNGTEKPVVNPPKVDVASVKSGHQVEGNHRRDNEDRRRGMNRTPSSGRK